MVSKSTGVEVRSVNVRGLHHYVSRVEGEAK